jgi:hypothetical protein
MSYLKEQKQAYSRPVYGYDIVNGRLHENEHEQRVIAQVKAWRRQGMPQSHCRAAE